MEQTDIRGLDENVLTTPERPQFLQVLCILSFIGCGIMLLLGLFGLRNLFMTPEEILMSPNIQALKEMSPESYQNVVDSMEFKNISAITGILFPALSLIGAILMWNLKKTGFFLYLAGELLPYIIIAATSGFASMTHMGGMMEEYQSMINVVLVLVVVFDFVFIILYALNLKRMY